MSPLQEHLVSDFLRIVNRRWHQADRTVSASTSTWTWMPSFDAISTRASSENFEIFPRYRSDTRGCVTAEVLRCDGLRPAGPVDPIPDSANQRGPQFEVLGFLAAVGDVIPHAHGVLPFRCSCMRLASLYRRSPVSTSADVYIRTDITTTRAVPRMR